jgi:hypothetical protein
MFQSATKIPPSKPRHPRLRAMQIKIKRDNLGIKPEKQYTSAEALEKAAEAESAAESEPKANFHNRTFYFEARRNWLELAVLLAEEEQVQASA